MNVKNINDFLHDIDEEQIVDWRIESDCHEKVKKLILEVETVLMEEEYEKTIQITKERSRRDCHSLGHRPDKRWEGFPDDLPTFIVDEIREEAIGEELDAPILYDGHFYWENEKRYK